MNPNMMNRPPMQGQHQQQQHQQQQPQKIQTFDSEQDNRPSRWNQGGPGQDTKRQRFG
jgi:hypothetical protein